MSTSPPDLERARRGAGPHVPRERRSRLGSARVHGRAEVDGRRPRVVDAVTRGGPDVLTSQRARPVGAEDDLTPVLANVRLDVVCRRVVQLTDGHRRPEGARDLLADEYLPGRSGREGAPREVELLSRADLDVRRPLLVEGAVRAGRRAGEVLGPAPAARRVEAREVDVTQTACSRAMPLCLRRRAPLRVPASGRSRPPSS